jgi:alanine racemase
MPAAADRAHSLTKAHIRLDHITHNLRLLQALVGARPLWPAIKANAYGQGMAIVARHLVAQGYDTLCVAHVTEALELMGAGIAARYAPLAEGRRNPGGRPLPPVPAGRTMGRCRPLPD